VSKSVEHVSGGTDDQKGDQPSYVAPEWQQAAETEHGSRQKPRVDAHRQHGETFAQSAHKIAQVPPFRVHLQREQTLDHQDGQHVAAAPQHRQTPKQTLRIKLLTNLQVGLKIHK